MSSDRSPSEHSTSRPQLGSVLSLSMAPPAIPEPPLGAGQFDPSSPVVLVGSGDGPENADDGRDMTPMSMTLDSNPLSSGVASALQRLSPPNAAMPQFLDQSAFDAVAATNGGGATRRTSMLDAVKLIHQQVQEYKVRWEGLGSADNSTVVSPVQPKHGHRHHEHRIPQALRPSSEDSSLSALYSAGGAQEPIPSTLSKPLADKDDQLGGTDATNGEEGAPPSNIVERMGEITSMIESGRGFSFRDLLQRKREVSTGGSTDGLTNSTRNSDLSTLLLRHGSIDTQASGQGFNASDGVNGVSDSGIQSMLSSSRGQPGGFHVQQQQQQREEPRRKMSTDEAAALLRDYAGYDAFVRSRTSGNGQ